MEQSFEYETPTSCLKRLVEYDDSDPFQIIFNLTKLKQNFKNNEGQQLTNEEKIIINTTKNKARSISKKINDVQQVDPTISEYSFAFPEQLELETANHRKEEIERIIHTLLRSTISKVKIIKNHEKLSSIIMTVLNGQQYSANGLKYEIKSQEEAISLLSTEFHSKSIEYLSVHITEFISNSSFNQIEEGIINDVIDFYISHRSKEKEEEIHSIFDILTKQGEVNIVMHFLLSIEIEEYDKEMIEYIYKNLDDDIIFNEMTRIIFTLKSHFLKLLSTSKKQNDTTREEKECEYNGNELSGIIDYLQKQNGADLESKNILKLSGGGFPSPSYPITNLIKYNSNNMNNEYYYNYCGGTPSSSDGWIEFDFVNKTVNLTSYTIRTRSCYYPKSWRIVGSNDHEHWEDIDHRVNNSELNGGYKQHRFENSKSDKYYRYIRYIQEEQWSNSSCNYYIYLTRIEFFGTLHQNHKHLFE